MSKEMKLAVRIFAHFVKHTLFVIARRERKRRTRQSIVSRMTRTTCLFAYWFRVDRDGHSALGMTEGKRGVSSKK
jgi:hypothetical protein